MDRYEFINVLRSALAGKVPATTLEDNVRYYEEYIDIQIRQGKSEEEVLSELGDPRLLARTIIEANKYAEGTESYESGGEYSYSENEGTFSGSGKSFMEWYRELPHWVHTIMTVLIMLLVLFVVFTALQVLFPIICFIMIGILIYRLIRQIFPRY